MRTKPTLSTKLLAMGAGFLLVALASISLTLWVTWKLEGGAAAVNEAGRLRMNMLRMVLVLQTEPTEAVQERARLFDASLDLLRTGDPSRPLFVPWSDETRSRFEAIRTQWAQARSGWVTTLPPDRAQTLAQADAFVQQVDGFVDAIEIQIAGWTAALHLFQLFMMALAIVAAVTFMAASYLLVINPVARLQQAQARLRQGELGTRLPVDTDDEFGQLSAGFNLMAHALQASHDDLEHKVVEKTASIAVQNQRLAALYEVSALASTASSLELLAQGFVQQIRRVAGAAAGLGAQRFDVDAVARRFPTAATSCANQASGRGSCARRTRSSGPSRHPPAERAPAAFNQRDFCGEIASTGKTSAPWWMLDRRR